MSTDYTSLITSEHADKPNFVSVVGLAANGIGAITDLLQSIPGKFDLDSAIGGQLDIVGLWVGVSRTVANVPAQFFGFADDLSALTFGELTDTSIGARFLELGESPTTSAILGDAEFRLVIRAKIIRNDYDGSIGQLEQAVVDLVSVPCKFIDPGNKVVLIVLTQPVDFVTQALLTSYDLLPRPAGIRYQIVFPQTGLVWQTAGTASFSNGAVSKLSGASAWDSSAFVALPSTKILLSWTIVSTASNEFIMGGLAANPSGSPNYPSLNYGLYNSGSGEQVYESGNSIGSFGTLAPGDTVGVYTDGKSAIYLHNWVPFRMTAVAVGSYSPMFTIFNPLAGAQAQNIQVFTGI